MVSQHMTDKNCVKTNSLFVADPENEGGRGPLNVFLDLEIGLTISILGVCMILGQDMT